MEAVPPPPAPKNPPPAPAPPPQAPALSYQLVGRMDEGSRPRAIFSNSLRTEVLGVGEVLDRQWRIDAIEPQAVQLSWLRGEQKKTLSYP